VQEESAFTLAADMEKKWDEMNRIIAQA